MEESNKQKECLETVLKKEEDSKQTDEDSIKQDEYDNKSRKGSTISNASSSGGSWWGSWINTAKEKTSTVFEAVKNDLDELSNVISTQASSVGAALENTLKFDENADVSLGTVKKSLSSFFGQVTDALIPSLEYDETETILITHDGLVTLSGFPKHLAELQSNDKTYCEPPEPELKQQYRRWMEVVEQDQFTQDRLAKHLTGSEILNDKYINLVPDKVSHMDFWQRYLFKRALLEDAIANAELAEKRANIEIHSDQPSTSPKKNLIQTEQPKLSKHNTIAEEGIQLGEELEEEIEEKEIEIDVDVEELENELLNNDIQCNVELSEEEQIRLLEEYELEIQEREKVTTSNTKTSPAKVKTPEKKQPQGTQQSAKQNNLKNQKTSNKTANNNKKDENTKNKTQNNQQQTRGKFNSQQGSAGKKSANAQQKNFNKQQKDKDENSSTSDESWEKDFDLN